MAAESGIQHPGVTQASPTIPCPLSSEECGRIRETSSSSRRCVCSC